MSGVVWCSVDGLLIGTGDRLATMQTSLAETRQELDDVTKELERTMLGDGVAVLVGYLHLTMA